jgi:hypothetical protein
VADAQARVKLAASAGKAFALAANFANLSYFSGGFSNLTGCLRTCSALIKDIGRRC